MDYTVFKQTREQKAEAKLAKQLWKKNMIIFYGADWRKHNNYPCKLKP